MERFKGLFTNILILGFALSIGIALSAALFLKDNVRFNLRDMLNLDNQNTQSVLERNLERENPGSSGTRVVVSEESAVIDVIEQTSPAVVSIVSEQVGLDPFQGIIQREGGIGTGFIVDKSGIIFTNKHVVSDEDINYSVALKDGETTYEVEEINRDPLNDFAILKIDPKGQELPVLQLGDSENLKVGQSVIAIGNALGELSNSASLGIVSGIGRSIVAGGGAGGSETLDNVIQTDAALNPGNSGGPLLDLGGKVIGINVARVVNGENIGFAIPINAIKPVYDSFKQIGEIQRPFLGIQYSMNTQSASRLNRVPVGAVITEVVPDTPAERAGLERFDVILEIDGTKLDEDNTLAEVIARKKVGDRVRLRVDRDGRIVEITVTLEAAR